MSFDGGRVGSLTRGGGGGGGGGREVGEIRGDPSSSRRPDTLALDDHAQQEVGAAIR